VHAFGTEVRRVSDGLQRRRRHRPAAVEHRSAGERALNSYLVAANAWGECLATASCELEAVEPRLQRQWARASDLLGSVQTGL